MIRKRKHIFRIIRSSIGDTYLIVLGDSTAVWLHLYVGHPTGGGGFWSKKRTLLILKEVL